MGRLSKPSDDLGFNGKIGFALDAYAIAQQNIARPRNLRIMPEKSKNVYLKPEG